MTQRKYKIFGTTLILLGTLAIALIFYFIWQENFIEDYISKPGPLTAKEEKEIEEILSDKEIIKITNEYRGEEGLNSLEENEILNKAAMERVEDMFEKQYFAHVSPDGKDISDTLDNVHYEYVVSGENLALGYFKDSRDLVDAWMASEGHRANILNSKFAEIGVAHKMDIYDGKKQYIAVQIFAKPMSDCPVPDKNLKKQIDSKQKEVEYLEKELENLQKEINSLENSIENLYEEIQNLYAEAKILARKGDRGGASEKIDEANSKKEELQTLQKELEQKVDDYNNLIGRLKSEQSSLRNLIIKYNNQVEKFNQCVKN